MMLTEEIDTLRDLHQDILQGLNSDLETGSHHFNNAASDEFVKKYPDLMKAIRALDTWIEKQEELWSPA